VKRIRAARIRRGKIAFPVWGSSTEIVCTVIYLIPAHVPCWARSLLTALSGGAARLATPRGASAIPFGKFVARIVFRACLVWLGALLA